MGTQWSVVGDSWQAVGGNNKEKGKMEEGKERKEMKHRKATATNAQLHLRRPFDTAWRLKKSNRAPNAEPSQEKERSRTP